MPNRCSAPNCKSNYYPGDPYIPVFKLPNEPEEIRKQWFNALRRENISELKHVFVCIHHFHDNDVERTYKIPNPDGSLSEIPRGQPKLKKGAIPSLLPGCAPYYSESSSKPTRLSFDHKEDIHFQKAIILSRESQQIEELKYRITSLAGLKEYLFHFTLPTDWYSWFSHDRIRIINPLQSQGNVTISICSYISNDSSLNVSAFHEQEIPPPLEANNPTKSVFAIMASSLHKKWSSIIRLLPISKTSAQELFPIIRKVICDIELLGISVQVICTDNNPLNVHLFKLFSPDGKTLQSCVPHPADATRPLVLMFDFVHILKSIRNNWINLKNINQTFIYPDLSTINLSHISYPLRINTASFDDIRQQYLSEKHKVAKLAPRLTAKSCWPTSLERQNVKLALKIFDESTLAAISLRNEANHNSQTEDFINIILKLWKIFNINRPNKDLRFKEDDFSRQLIQNDERFSFLSRIVYWIDVWKALPGKGGKLSPQTFTSLKHSCLALPILVNFLTSECRFNYVLSYFLQTDPIEHHFGLYTMLSGANYHISLCQILESERRLKVSDILNLFSQQPSFKQTALQNFIQSFSPEDEYHSDNIDLTHFLSELPFLSTIFLDTTTLQSLAYIAGYSVHLNL